VDEGSKKGKRRRMENMENMRVVERGANERGFGSSAERGEVEGRLVA
jgi:hypothetical protein